MNQSYSFFVSFFIIVFSLIYNPGFGQANSEQTKNTRVDLQKEIDESLWQPFITSFEKYDTERFMQLHDTGMIRVLIDKNRILGYKNYQTMSRRIDSTQKASNIKRTIEFTFTKRVANNHNAFEEGYYKSSVIHPNGKIESFYGKFWVLLIKDNNIWKVKMDADTSDGITEQVYNSIR